MLPFFNLKKMYNSNSSNHPIIYNSRFNDTKHYKNTEEEQNCKLIFIQFKVRLIKDLSWFATFTITNVFGG